jgi:hypothetical protein
VFSAIAREEAKIQAGDGAHLSTQTTLDRGEAIAGGGLVFCATCRQKFAVLEVLHGKGKTGDRVLEYGLVEKTEGFPLPEVQEPIPGGAKIILLMRDKEAVLKALPDTPENRKAVQTVLSEQKGKQVEPGPDAADHKAADVLLIAGWLTGKDSAQAFAKPFGDSRCVPDGQDALLHTDIPAVKPPAGMKGLNYEMA